MGTVIGNIMESEPFGEAKGYKQAAAASQVYNQGKLLHLD
jgi:hypothetical protein